MDISPARRLMQINVPIKHHCIHCAKSHVLSLILMLGRSRWKLPGYRSPAIPSHSQPAADSRLPHAPAAVEHSRCVQIQLQHAVASPTNCPPPRYWPRPDGVRPRGPRMSQGTGDYFEWIIALALEFLWSPMIFPNFTWKKKCSSSEQSRNLL